MTPSVSVVVHTPYRDEAERLLAAHSASDVPPEPPDPRAGEVPGTNLGKSLPGRT